MKNPISCVEFGLGPAGDRCAERDVGALTGLVQRDGDRRLQQHELGDAEVAGEARELGAGGAVDGELDGIPLPAGHRRPWEVGVQARVLRAGRPAARASTRAVPQRVRRVGQQRGLPGGVVGVLHRQRGELGRLAVVPGPVGGQQVGEQHPRRPVVGGDVVHHQRQHVRLAGRQHRGPDRQVALEVEAVLAFRSSSACSQASSSPRARRTATSPASLTIWYGTPSISR